MTLIEQFNSNKLCFAMRTIILCNLYRLYIGVINKKFLNSVYTPAYL